MTLSASITTTLTTLTPYIVSLVALLVFLEQISYLKKKRSVPGPLLIFPFLGNAANLVRDPTRFWDAQTRFAKSSGFSANYIVGKFIIFIRSSELSHKIFSNVRPDAFHLVGHPFGKKLFGEHNLIYMFGEAHKSLRRRIAPNFTVKALRTYTEIQQRIIFRHIRRWLDVAGENDSPVAMRLLVRDMNLETSQTVFVGPYLADESRRRFEADYNLFNVGLMKLPVDLPGFAFRNARFAVERLVDALGACAERSVERMERGEEPSCLIDFWMQDTIRETAGSESAAVSHSSVRENAESPAVSDSKVHENGESAAVSHSSVRENGESEAVSGSPVHENGGSPAVSQPSCREIGGHLFDFLFAAQDASTSSLLWAVTLLESHPEVLRKVREEVAGIWSPDSGSLITAEQLAEMRYTLAVAREVVRYRAPATMVPHIAGEDFPLTESYTIPKGTIVFPSVFESSFQGFTEADRFDPDRFSSDRQEDRVFKRNFLAFGAGPHQCVGQRYALNHLVLFIAMFTAMVDFKRHRTDGCDEIMYVPTICPKDDCKVYLSPRCSKLHAPE